MPLNQVGLKTPQDRRALNSALPISLGPHSRGTGPVTQHPSCMAFKQGPCCPSLVPGLQESKHPGIILLPRDIRGCSQTCMGAVGLDGPLVRPSMAFLMSWPSMTAALAGMLPVLLCGFQRSAEASGYSGYETGSSMVWGSTQVTQESWGLSFALPQPRWVALGKLLPHLPFVSWLSNPAPVSVGGQCPGLQRAAELPRYYTGEDICP